MPRGGHVRTRDRNQCFSDEFDFSARQRHFDRRRMGRVPHESIGNFMRSGI